MDHDISLLVPEIWCRMESHERDPQFLIENGYLEKVERFRVRRPHRAGQPAGLSHHGAVCRHFLGRIFETPDAVFTEEMLRPEKQGLECSPKASNSIVEAQTRVALQLLRRWQRGSRLPAAEGAAAHHGDTAIMKAKASTIRRSGPCYPREL